MSFYSSKTTHQTDVLISDKELIQLLFEHASKDNMKRWFGTQGTKYLMLHLAGEQEMKRYIEEKITHLTDSKLTTLLLKLSLIQSL